MIINEAISEEIFPFDKNPFHRYKLKTENVRKAFLTEEELLSLELMTLEPGTAKDIHRNMYIFEPMPWHSDFRYFAITLEKL